MRYNKAVKEINVYHMILYVISKYRSLLLLLGIGIVVSVCVGLYTNNDNQNSLFQGQHVGKEYIADEAILQDMEMALEYYSMYISAEEYMKKSYLMEINPNEEYIGKLYFEFVNNSKEGYSTKEYENILYSDELIAQIKEVIGGKFEDEYIRESISLNLLNQGSDSRIVEVRIRACEEKTAKDIVALINQYVFDELNKKMESNVDIYVGDVYVTTDVELLNMQKEIKAAYKTFSDAYKAKLKNYTDDERAYFREHFLNDVSGNAANYSSDEINVDFSNAQIFIMVEFVFTILFLLYWVIRYCVTDKIHTRDEVAMLFDNDVYGILADKHTEKQNSLDMIIKEKMYSIAGLRTSLEYAREEMKIRAENSSFIICYAGTGIGSKGNAIFEKMEEPISCSIESLRKAKAIGEEILVVELEKTSRRLIECELQIAQKHGINVKEIVLI